jgi:cell division protein FtsQ
LKTQNSKPETRNSSQARPGLRRVLEWSLKTGKLIALLVLGVAGWLLYDALTSPQYVVRTVSAQGLTALSVENVQQLADVTGRPIWFVDDAGVEARVSQSPYVEQVNAHVILPDRVVVEVKERRPDVRWTHGGNTYAVTWDGLVLDRAADGAATQPVSDTSGLIGPLTITRTATMSDTQAVEKPALAAVSIVDTTPNRELKPGDRVDVDALEVARRVSLRAAELPTPPERIEWDAGLGVSLIVGGKQAVVGKSDRLDEKLAILAQLLRDGTPFSYLDLRPTTPFYR